MASFKFFNSDEYKDFFNWCDKNNRDPTKLLKKMMRLTVIYDMDLDEYISNLMNEKIIYDNLPPVYAKKKSH
jgi:hypothetical protein